MNPVPPPPPPATATAAPSAESLLLRAREQMRVVLGMVYLLYMLLTWVFNLPALTSSLEMTRLWGLLAVMVVILVNYFGLIRISWVNLVLHGFIVPLMWWVGYQMLEQHVNPSPYLLWISVVVLTLFTMLGSVTGGVLTLVLAAGLLTFLILFPPLPEHQILWITGTSTVLGISILGFIIMRFIEQNLLLHVEANNKLRAARLDALTGIAGRAALEESMRRSAAHARKSRTPLSVILTDIDHFKQVNDKHGHNMGDEVLRSFAKRLSRNLRSSGGTVGRWGGEEFLIVLPGVSRTDALAVAERLRNEVTLSPLSGLPITASFGVASYRAGEEEDLEQLVARADERLYEAKNAGRNAVR